VSGGTSPEVMDTLTDLAERTFAGTIDVRNGTVVGADTAGEGLIIGYKDTPAPWVATGSYIREGYDPNTQHENYIITGAVKVATGEDDYLPARRRAFEILTIFRRALLADYRLGGSVLSAMVATWNLQEPPDGTTTITLVFGVAVDAYTSV